MNKHLEKEQWISMAGLKARGWTPKLIEQFLGQPERTAPNPHYRSAPPMRLWSLKSVIAVEETPAFQTALAQARRRQEGAKKGAEHKQTLTLELARSLPLKIKKMPLHKLLRAAQKHYLDRKGEWVEFSPWNEPDPFRDRLCVNYLRHQASKYDDHLETLKGKVGISKAYLLLWRRIVQAIEATYPELGAEAWRQYRERANQP